MFNIETHQGRVACERICITIMKLWTFGKKQPGCVYNRQGIHVSR